VTAFAVVAVIVAVVLAVLLVRTRSRVEELESTVRSALVERDERMAELRVAREATSVAERQRDEALERVQRARRDAADVANRLREETAARSQVEADLTVAVVALEEARGSESEAAAALEEARNALIDTNRALDEARAAGSAGAPTAVASAGTDGSDGSTAPVDPAGTRYGEEMWALALRATEHTWRVSVAPGLGVDSPIAGSDNPFRTAVEVEVDAAREEAGAELELNWGDGPVQPPPECAALALALIRDVIAELGTTAARTDLTVCAAPDAVDVRVAAVDETGTEMAVPLPPSLEMAPGHARVPAA
jgi:hypothetical protein